MNTDDFISLCDGTDAEVRSTDSSENFYREECVRIKDVLTPSTDESMPFSEFEKLRTGFIYLSILDDKIDYSPYYYILEKISNYFNGSTQKIVSWTSDVWGSVIAYVKSLPEYPRTDAFTNEFIRVREREVAKAAKRLREFGATVIVKNCELTIENTECIYARIEQLMTEIGGETALHLLISELPFMNKIGRYLLPHQGNQVMTTFVELEKPYGYLFNLCLKFMKEKGSLCEIRKKWNEICEIATDLVIAVYNSQKFDLWEDIVYKPEEVVNVVHKMVQRYNLYTLPQTIVSFALDWCRFLCKSIRKNIKCNIGLNTKLVSMERLMTWAAKASNNKSCVHIKKNSKSCELLNKNKVGIEDFLFVNVNSINANFQQPEDLNMLNGVMFPIIETETDYIFLPKPLVIWNWYEAIFNVIRSDKNKELAKDIGHIMEDYVRNKMNTHGIISHTGKYEYNSTKGEVDFLIESTQADVYIESKKKSLSLKARAGDDYYIWGDLYDIIHSQMQCARLENGVKCFGPITLTEEKNRKSYEYRWKNEYVVPHPEDEKKENVKQRFVLKTTMTLKEYGPMQDKIVLSNIVKSLIGKNIIAKFDWGDTVHDEEDQKRLKDVYVKINKALNDIMDYYKAIGGDNPTFFCRFYSMEQIYFLIRVATNQDDFVKLLHGGFVTTGTENFWNEFVNTMINVKCAI